MRYRFYDVDYSFIANRRANEILSDLRKVSKNIYGVCVIYYNKVIEIDFDEKVSEDEINKVKEKLKANRIEKCKQHITVHL